MEKRMPNDDLFIDMQSYRRKQEAIEVAKKELAEIRNKKALATPPKNTVDDPSSEWDELRSKEAAKQKEINDKKAELAKFKVIDSLEADDEKVNLNDKVSLHLLYSDGEESTTTYVLVGAEPDRKNREISKDSPIGKSIYGKKLEILLG